MASNTPEPAAPVPDQLMDELHKANQKFHEARVELEHQMEGSEDHHQQRVDSASEGLRAAERQVEAVTEQIDKSLHGEDGQISKAEPDRSAPAT
ncbi:MAG TPA: hypothetical protein VIM11_27845 [Tepidisphaeraceae bacterium]|jgi:hypothetical protein